MSGSTISFMLHKDWCWPEGEARGSTSTQVCAYHGYQNQCTMEAETVSNCSQCGDLVWWCSVYHPPPQTECVSPTIGNQVCITHPLKPINGRKIAAEDCIQSLLDGITAQDIDTLFCERKPAALPIFTAPPSSTKEDALLWRFRRRACNCV